MDECQICEDKLVSVLDKLPLCEGVWGNGGVASCILNLDTRWRWMVSFTPWLLYPRENSPGTLRIGGWMESRTGQETVAKRNKPCPYLESNPVT